LNEPEVKVLAHAAARHGGWLVWWRPQRRKQRFVRFIGEGAPLWIPRFPTRKV
jgi:hypothetical protein